MTIGESPAWLKARLIGAGMRPISNVVDITNYVMLALGSPLHAYDKETLAGDRIVVRRATPGEQIVTLDGTRRELDPADLVIADAERPIGLAGVHGRREHGGLRRDDVGRARDGELRAADGAEAAASAITCAPRPDALGERRRPGAAAYAASYASELLAELAGARWTGETEVRGEAPAPPRIAFRPAYASEALGLAMPEDEQRERLARLGFEVRRRLARGTSRRGARATFGATSTSSRRSRGSGSRTCRRRCPCARRCSAG